MNKREIENWKNVRRRGLVFYLIITVFVAAIGSVLGSMLYQTISGTELSTSRLFETTPRAIFTGFIVTILIWIINERRYRKGS
jgi:H+/Cl- antiporter ClcA